MTAGVPLVLAGHGTRDPRGVQAYGELVERVRARLPGIRVEAGFVEITPPTIEEALARVLSDGAEAVVVPLMIGTGGHVLRDIPDSIDTALAGLPATRIVRARHLGSPVQLVAAIRQRIAVAAGQADPAEVSVVMVGRGSSLAEPNADHLRLCRRVQQEGGYARVVPAFIQVTRPSVPQGLDRILALGGRLIVVLPHFLFPGRLRTWTREQASAWHAGHPEVTLGLAEVVGPCDELVEVIVQRYGEARSATRDSRAPFNLQVETQGYTASRAAAMSAIRSSGSSSPTESRRWP